jgi:hypothetical protein
MRVARRGPLHARETELDSRRPRCGLCAFPSNQEIVLGTEPGRLCHFAVGAPRMQEILILLKIGLLFSNGLQENSLPFSASNLNACLSQEMLLFALGE